MTGQFILIAALLASATSVGAASAASSGGFNITIESGSENASCRGGKAAFSARQEDGAPGRGAESSFVAQVRPGFYQQVAVAPLVGPGNKVGSAGCEQSAPGK